MISSFIEIGEEKVSDLEDKLTAMLYRSFCPDTTELGEYQFELLDEDRAASIRQHLLECPHCTRELNQLRQYLEDLSPDLEYSLAEKVKIWVARLVPDFGGAGPAPSPAFALRGESKKLLLFQAGDAQLTIEMQEHPRQPGWRSLLGLVFGIDPDGLQAHLWQEGRKLASSEVDELGNFAFPHLDAGRYELILSKPEFEIHVQELIVP